MVCDPLWRPFLVFPKFPSFQHSKQTNIPQAFKITKTMVGQFLLLSILQENHGFRVKTLRATVFGIAEGL